MILWIKGGADTVSFVFALLDQIRDADLILTKFKIVVHGRINILRNEMTYAIKRINVKIIGCR